MKSTLRQVEYEALNTLQSQVSQKVQDPESLLRVTCRLLKGQLALLVRCYPKQPHRQKLVCTYPPREHTWARGQLSELRAWYQDYDVPPEAQGFFSEKPLRAGGRDFLEALMARGREVPRLDWARYELLVFGNSSIEIPYTHYHCAIASKLLSRYESLTRPIKPEEMQADARIGGSADRADSPALDDIFISYAHADADIARRLVEKLGARDLKLWFDEHGLRSGQDWDLQIRRALDRSRVCVVLLTPAAVRSRPWISKEWSAIQECSWRREDFTIYPIRLGDVDRPPFLRPWQSLSLDTKSSDLESTVSKIVEFVRDSRPKQRPDPSQRDRAAAADRFSEIWSILTENAETDRQEET